MSIDLGLGRLMPLSTILNGGAPVVILYMLNVI